MTDTTPHVPIKRLPQPYPPHRGAVRSFTTKQPFGRFVISNLTRYKMAKRDSWIVEDRASGALRTFWTRHEGLAAIHELLTPPSGPLAFLERFVVWSAPTDPVTDNDAVLYDRVTGRFWKRKLDNTVHESIAVMMRLQPYLSGEYHERQRIRYPAPPAEWARPTSNGAGAAGRAAINSRRTASQP